MNTLTSNNKFNETLSNENIYAFIKIKQCKVMNVR